MRILITGGAGYIGSHTAKLLARAGFHPVVVDNLSNGHRHAVRWGPLIELDLADKDGLRSVLRAHSIEAVIHFAAFAYVGDSMLHPGRYFQNNVSNTINLLEAMREEDVRRIVFSSSCAVYGHPARLPIPEDHATDPANPYGESKRMVEKILRWYGEQHGFSWIALRYFNAAGADPEGELGEEHDPETHLIPLVIAAAQGRIPEVQIFGTDYATPDGTAVRDYIHVTDLAEAHRLALGKLLAGRVGTTLNLGTGRGYSVREVIQAVEAASQRPVPASEHPRRPGDPPALTANADNAARLLGWRPAYSDLRTIVETAWRWHNQAAPAVVEQVTG